MDNSSIDAEEMRGRPKTDYPLILRVPSSFRKSIKKSFSYLPASYRLKLLTHFGDFRIWKKENLSADTPKLADRYELYGHLIESVLPETFIYLEFGCAAGKTVEWWANKVIHADARFIGFDTFEGMPEVWRGLTWSTPEGAWSQYGKLPETTDDRVSYVQGKFQDSLEPYLEKAELEERFDHLVIHIDADMYTSSLFVLTVMRPYLKKATVIFDEFDCVLDELRSLEDFSKSFGLKYTVLATARECEQVAIQFDFDVK